MVSGVAPETGNGNDPWICLLAVFQMRARHRNSAGRRIEPARGGCYPQISMTVTAATATMSAATTAAVVGRRVVAAGAGGGEHGKLLGQFL